MEESEKIELEYRRLLTEAMTTHGGYIFLEDFEEGLKGSTTLQEATEEMIEYIAEDLNASDPNTRKAAQKIHFEFQKGNLLGAWIEYFKAYPTHGEYAGFIVGILEREKKFKEALEILKTCKEANGGELWWDT